MIKLKGFEKYYFDLNTCEVFRLKETGELIKKKPKHNNTYYLSKNGINIKMTRFDIIKNNLEEIEKHFKNARLCA